MLISHELISLSLDNAIESLNSSPMESSLDFPGEMPLESDLLDLPPLPTNCTDVNVVPEHEKNNFELSISNLEGKIFNFDYDKLCGALVSANEAILLILVSMGF